VIGPHDRDAKPTQRVEQAGRRVAVVVVQPDADDRDPWAHCREELRHKVRRAMMGDLEHIGAQVGTRIEQCLLCVDLGVTGQQDAQACGCRSQHH